MDTENRQLLKKYLYGICSSEELQRVKLLLEEPEAEEILHAIMVEQPGTDNLTVNEDDLKNKVASWKAQVQQRITVEAQNTSEKLDLPVKKMRYMRYAAIWAGIMLVSAVAVWQVKKNTQPVQVAFVDQVNRKGVPVKYVLPDGSELYLGAGSKVHYPLAFAGKVREIELSGEAFFNVKHDTAKPFIIHTGEVTTQVLGTSFKIEAFNNSKVMVAVATGKVGVTEKKSEHSRTLGLLTPGLKITWNGQTGKVVKGTVDIYNLLQWNSGKMAFDQENMGDVAKTLERRYGVRIIFDDKDAATYHVSGTFSPNESVTSILQLLGAIGKFKFETANDNRTFHIYKNSISP